MSTSGGNSLLVLQSGIPVFLQSSGTIGNNGALTGLTALATTYTSIYLYFPVNTIAAGVAAGLYYCVMSSTTAGTIYNNTYDPSLGVLPTIPVSPAAFATTGPGAYVQTTATDITLVGVTIPGGSMGINGDFTISPNWVFLNNANVKTLKIKVAGVAVLTNTPTASSANNTEVAFQNKGSQSRQSMYIITGTSPPSFLTNDHAVDQIITFTAQLATATDYAGNESRKITINYTA